MKKTFIVGGLICFIVFFQNVAVYKTGGESDIYSSKNFEQVRCELELSDSKLIVVATYELETDVATLMVKLLDDVIIQDVHLNGTRVEDEENFVNYITSEYVFRFNLDDDMGIPKPRFSILESPDISYDLGDNCVFE